MSNNQQREFVVIAGRKLKLSKAAPYRPGQNGFFSNWGYLSDEAKEVLNECAAKARAKQDKIIERLRALANYGFAKDTIYC
ncbi:MAG: hypothetical protein V1719_02300 [Patescibacteria group bacterium]